MPNKLTYDDASHSYFLDGVRIPSVTEVLQGAGLTDFSAVPAAVLKAACAFGKAVHLACEFHDRGVLDEDALDPALKPYLEGWKKFKQFCDFAPNEIEQPIYSSTYRFAGTPDRVGLLCGGFAIVDIKSGADNPATAIQLAGYALIVNDVIKKPIIRIAVLLDRDGKYRIKEYRDKMDKDTFLAALSVYNWRKKRVKCLGIKTKHIQNFKEKIAIAGKEENPNV